MLAGLFLVGLSLLRVSAQETTTLAVAAEETTYTGLNFTYEERLSRHEKLLEAREYFFAEEANMNLYGLQFNANISDARAVSAAKNIKLNAKIAFVNNTIDNLRILKNKQYTILATIQKSLRSVLGFTAGERIIAAIEANRNADNLERVPVADLFPLYCAELEQTYLDPTITGFLDKN